MGATPQFASTVHNTSTPLSTTAETNQGTPAHATLCFAAGANGSKIEEIVAAAITPSASLISTTNAGLIYIYLYNTSTSAYYYFDTVTISAVTSSTTVAPFRSAPSRYPNLFLESGWEIYASVTVQPSNNGQIMLNIFGGDY